MPENGNGTLKARLWSIVGGVILASIVGYGSSMISIGQYSNQIEVNTHRLDLAEPKLEKLAKMEADLDWIRKALDKNDTQHEQMLIALRDLGREVKKND